MPTHRLGPQRQQDPVRLKNLLRQAEDRLRERGHRDMETKEMLEPAWQLVEDMSFWQYQSDGLALFIAPGVFQSYRLPLDLAEQVFVSDRFLVKPVLPILNGDGLFYVLALSQGDVRLLRGSRDGVSEVELQGVPRSLGEALRYDEYGENQYYTNTTSSVAAGGGAAKWAGSGVSLDDDRDNIVRFCRKVDQGLQRYLRDEQAPLVLAGVEYLLPIYREVNSYQHLNGEAIIGNPDEVRAEELHERGWELVKPLFAQEQQEAIDRFRRYQGANQELASHDPREILPAAFYGRIDTLFIAVNEQIWGTFDAQNNELEVHDEPQEGDVDLIDLAAVHTLLNSGQVFSLQPEELGDDGPVAAIFRYGV